MPPYRTIPSNEELKLQDLQDVLVLPEASPHSEPSWFGFPILVREDAPFSRNDLVNGT
jgi:CDP-6-deoxy-D-xylo-4-hexulose-3-dehydrase